MFYIQSKRLRLIPLTRDMFMSCIKDRVAFEISLGLNPSNLEMDDFFKKEYDDAVVNFWIPQLAANPEQYQWITNWEIVLLEENTIIGGIGIAGIPDKVGETNTGYMISKKHWNKGYATEALNCLCDWVFSHEHINCINANTLIDGFTSQRVLIKAGFLKIGEDEKECQFKKTRQQTTQIIL